MRPLTIVPAVLDGHDPEYRATRGVSADQGQTDVSIGSWATTEEISTPAGSICNDMCIDMCVAHVYGCAEAIDYVRKPMSIAMCTAICAAVHPPAHLPDCMHARAHTHVLMHGCTPIRTPARLPAQVLDIWSLSVCDSTPAAAQLYRSHRSSTAAFVHACLDPP